MICASDALPDDALSNIDVAIIGAGAVGVALAVALDGRACRVALIEAGGPKFEPRQQAEFFRADEIADARHPPTELYRRRMLGGTTSVWGGRCIPLDPEDLESGKNSPGWPVSHDEVAAWLPEAMHYLQAGKFKFSDSALAPSSAATNLVASDPDLQLDRIERFSEPTDVWRKWGEALVKSDHVLVVHGAACTDIRTSPDGRRVTGVGLRTRSNQNRRLNASVIILACGGLETPRLLLMSREYRSCGLGNENDLVGRFYMTHLGGLSGRMRFANLETTREFDYALTTDGVYGRRLIRISADTRRRERIGNIVFRPSVYPIEDPSHEDSILSAMSFAKTLVIPEYARSLVASASAEGWNVLLRHGFNVATGIPRLTRFGVNWLRRRTFATRKLPSVFVLRSDETYPLRFDAEQTPNFANRVTLGSSTDPYGMPRLAIRWTIDEDDIASITKAYHVLAAAWRRVGLGELLLDPDFKERVRAAIEPVGGHHIGTVRMGIDPRTSVVDSYGELWSTKGLFVAGCALFPSCGFANPTLTAVALAYRLVDRLAGRLGLEKG